MTQPHIDYQELVHKISKWSKELGFSQLGICDIDLKSHEEPLQRWLDNNYHGTMNYMERHGLKRARPHEIDAKVCRIISVRLDYLPENAQFAKTLKDSSSAYVSRYALGRDYHKLMRKLLQKLGQKITEHCADINYRPFVDSAPILERPLAEKAGLGWVGKHSLLINKKAGSWFFLGELFIDIPLPVTEVPHHNEDGCGNCTACINICPTQAIIEPYVVDARRCISYLTIESSEAIPIELRPLLGNRIYGCDDCQLICPWNKYAKLSQEVDFQARHGLDNISLIELFSWTESIFLNNFAGSPIRRIGFQNWLRNIAVALGNASYDDKIVIALKQKLNTVNDFLAEHIKWAIEQQLNNKPSLTITHYQKTNSLLIKAINKTLPRDA